MFDVIKQFFDTLLGYALPNGVYEIMSFALISTIFTALFTLFNSRARKIFEYSTYICIAVLAVLAVASSTSLSINFGG